MNSLLSFFARSTDALRDADISRLNAHGVTSHTLHAGASVVGVVEATVNESAGMWQPTPNGEGMFVVPCGERGPHNIGWRRIDDLCAFNLESPARWFLQRGIAVALNSVARDKASHFDEVLLLHDTPLDWLRHGADGCVILDRTAYLPLELGDVGRILVDSHLSKKRILDALRDELPPKRIPDIRVREITAYAA